MSEELQQLKWRELKRREELDRQRTARTGRYLVIRSVEVEGQVGDLTRQVITIDSAYGRLEPREVAQVLQQHFNPNALIEDLPDVCEGERY